MKRYFLTKIEGAYYFGKRNMSPTTTVMLQYMLLQNALLPSLFVYSGSG